MNVIFVVPPFGGVDRPAIGVHLLQSCVGQFDNVCTQVSYGNLKFACRIGLKAYQAVCYGPTTGLAGERVFAPLAFESVRFDEMNVNDESYFKRRLAEKAPKIDFGVLESVVVQARDWVPDYVAEILSQNPDVVGCSTTFEQTCAALTILKMIKAARPSVVTLLGGANCDGEMAHGLAEVAPFVDYIFSGECESAFPVFLKQFIVGKGPAKGVIEGSPCQNMDAIPTPDFREYYEQLEALFPNSELHQANAIWLPYESSRGCWWGQKNHCTFCGINGQTMAFREKSPDRVLEELKTLLISHPTKNVCMIDNIMPLSYFKTLLPRMTELNRELNIFYEQKANLKFPQVKALKDAGVGVIQPGIEALNTDLLKHMRKGVSAAQNIALLRYCRNVGLAVNWNLLYSFPHDKAEWYHATLEVLPLLSHLMPPTGVFHLSIDRFSPYFHNPEAYGIENVSPMEAYKDIFPRGAPLQRIAYHFVADYESAMISNPDVIEKIREAVSSWQTQWADGHPPALVVTELAPNVFMLLDTRGLVDGRSFEFISREQACVAVHGQGESDIVAWALNRKVAVFLDGKPIPLATCNIEVYDDLKPVSSIVATSGVRPECALVKSLS